MNNKTLIGTELNRPSPLLLDSYYLGLALIILTMPFPMRGNNLAMVFTVICWLILFFSNNNWKNYLKIIKSNSTAILLIIFSLLFVFSSLVHFNSYDSLDVVLKNIEKRIHILAYPVILSGVVFLSQKRIKMLLMLFVAAVIIAALMCLFIGLVITIKTSTIVHINPLNGIVENNFMYHRLGSYIGIHAVFFGAYVLFAFCILLIKYLWGIEKISTRNKVFHLASMLFLSLMIYLLSSISISLIFLLLTSSLLIYYLYQKVKNKRVLMASIVIILFIGIAFGSSVINKLDARENFLSYDLSLRPDKAGTDENNWNPLNIRLAILEVSLKVIKEHWVLGVGPANMKEVLDSYYDKYNFVFGKLDHFHPHNQYIHTFIVLGIGGFIVLMLFTFNICKKSFKSKDMVLGSLTILFILFSLTDSTLSVNKGIMFFSFFFSFLTYLKPRAMSVLVNNIHVRLPQ